VWCGDGSFVADGLRAVLVWPARSVVIAVDLKYVDNINMGPSFSERRVVDKQTARYKARAKGD
jgi:hypothetical protein